MTKGLHCTYYIILSCIISKSEAKPNGKININQHFEHHLFPKATAFSNARSLRKPPEALPQWAAPSTWRLLAPPVPWQRTEFPALHRPRQVDRDRSVKERRETLGNHGKPCLGVDFVDFVGTFRLFMTFLYFIFLFFFPHVFLFFLFRA